METSCITDITMVLTIEIRYEADEIVIDEWKVYIRKYRKKQSFKEAALL